MKRLIYFISVIFILIISSLGVPATDNNKIYIQLKTQTENVYSGQTVAVSVTAKSHVCKSINCLRLSLMYSGDNLALKQLVCDDDRMKLYSNVTNGSILTVLSCENESINLYPDVETELFTIYFKVPKFPKFNGENIKTKVSAKIVDISDDDGNLLEHGNANDAIFSIVMPKPPNCLLESLMPFEGELNPPFQPNIFDYTVDVSAEISRLEFYTKTKDPTSYARVSRETLSKPGTTTNIRVVVTSENKNEKKVYSISVNRAQKDKKSKLKKKSKKDSKRSSKNLFGDAFSDTLMNKKMSVNEPGSKTLTINEDKFLPFIVGIISAMAILFGVLFINKKVKKKQNECPTDTEQ